MENEIWKDIPEYEGKYQASSLGRIRSLDRVVYRKNGYQLPLKGKIISLHKDKKGYLRYRMCGQTKKIHRLIAETFIANNKNKPEVNHINGIKHDNRIENLEWVTSRENSIHSLKTGLHIALSGNNHPCSILTKKDVLHIRDEYDRLGRKKEAMFKIASGYKISHLTVRSIVFYRNHWTDAK